MSWITIQLGSREHYAIPRALWRAGSLERLLTDVWLSKWQSSFARPLLPSFAARRSNALPDFVVTSCTIARLGIDLRMRLRGCDAWQAILHRNAWFQEWCAAKLRQSKASTVFSYSYTARLPFALAKGRGARCILGQIDPGPREDEIVFDATVNYRHLATPADQAPKEYWDLWREEVALADRIIVNSPWSAKLLVEAGVSAAKLVEIPLVYERAESSVDVNQSSGVAGFGERRARSAERRPNTRLQALFLGSVILRKGVGQLFDAIKILKNEPIDFIIAGPIGVRIPDEISSMTNVRFLGPVSKAAAESLYLKSDVFLFPTLSDGFGLTQLEALGHGLPLIASMNCGEVVQDRVNGLMIPEVTPEAIADSVLDLVKDKSLLCSLKEGARLPTKCCHRNLASALLALDSSGDSNARGA